MQPILISGYPAVKKAGSTSTKIRSHWRHLARKLILVPNDAAGEMTDSRGNGWT
jgi:hypothetical protein